MMRVPSSWKTMQLEAVAEVQTGASVSANRNLSGTTVAVPYLRVANVKDGSLDLTEVKTIRLPKDRVERYLLRDGDVLLTEGGDFDKLGRGCVWHKEIKSCVHQNHIFAVRPEQTILLPEFLAALCASHYGRNYFLGCAKQTTNLASINSTQLKNFPLLIPSVVEQARICSVLNAWTASIIKIGSLVKAKRKIRASVMQQVFASRHRPQKHSDFVRMDFLLGEVFKERQESNRNDLPLLSITGTRGVVPQDELDKKDTSAVDKSKYKRIAPGDIGYNTMRMWQGVSVLSSIEGIVSPAYTICIPGPKIDGRFAKHLFKYPPMVRTFWRYSQGMVDDTLNLKFHNFALIKVKLPPIDEQRRIADALDALDREIDILTRQADALTRQKKALMQKLMTGQIRLKV